jgi:acetyl-CoA C-acetyltransferase
MGFDDWDGSYALTTRIAAERAYAEAGVSDPQHELDLVEVHDCFSITELVTMEDLKLSTVGNAWQDILAGKFDRDGQVPCNIDGGLKCFGHPIGATGLRMAYEVYLQLSNRAGDRQLANPTLGLTHNLGGFPNKNISSVSLFGHLQD